ncbi:transporter [Acinetobacter baumannii]|uniref:transporter n=1 Tax=Acinetobacter baumannii TaxID=470 RepID=UPI0023410A31|nr:transporter [Acinetobacter baumannii]MDC4919613.1 transporter [Acinetobacter baumannii]MDC4934157.1 transporter [Acinetobacter baumannii]
MTSYKKPLVGLLGITSILLSSHLYAVDVDAGDYDAATAGTSLALLYLQHNERNSLYDNSNKINSNIGLDSNIGILRFVHYTKVNNTLIAPQILIPFGQLEENGDLSNAGKRSGLGDIILSTAIWLYNDPVKKEYWGITPYLFVPTGQYDKDEALNLGENRYKLNLQSGYSKRIAPKLSWDLTGDITFYGDNDKVKTNSKLEQDMGYQLQTSLRYFADEKFDIRAGLSYQNNGDTKIDNVQTDAFKQTKFWVGTGINISPTSQAVLTYGRDLDVKNGFKVDNSLNLRLLYAF